MHLHSFRLKNYRRLRDVYVELAPDISIFVGANNSGKTSVAQALHTFASGDKSHFTFYDFSSHCWKILDKLGTQPEDTADPASFPSLSLDVWFSVNAADLHRVIHLLPSLSWQGTRVGVRIEFGPKDPIQLLTNFKAARRKADQQLGTLQTPGSYVPWPKTLSDYLQKELHHEFDFRYFVLDEAQFEEGSEQKSGYTPMPLSKEDKGASIVKSIIRIDCLNAQRHLADPGIGVGGPGRAEDLSKLLSRFYQHNLKQREDDLGALKALFDSEAGLNQHLAHVFKSTLKKLARLGYPGLHNPRIEIKSGLNPASVMRQDARVHYVIGDGDTEVRLPDNYNGLGYKNLVYMVVEVLDLQERWKTMEENRPPLHLIFIEEPETHLHAQLQQVFIKNILDLMKIEGEDDGAYSTQTVITTHSPHIVYERGFRPIRYFRRETPADGQACSILNLCRFYDTTDPEDRDFLERYLKLMHCDLFFADAAILVEGNVERLLLPAMIAKCAKKLKSACISILEVGGAFAHRFKTLIEQLGIITLVITDLDSVIKTPAGANEGDEDEEIDELESDKQLINAREQKRKTYRRCEASTPGAVTANQTLRSWLPKLELIEDLMKASAENKTQEPTSVCLAKVRVAYQTRQAVNYGGVISQYAGRTLEEAFGLENIEWCQAETQKSLKLKLKITPTSPTGLATGLFKRVTSTSFDKTNFALGVLTRDETEWVVPAYIKEGLLWLDKEVKIEVEKEMAAEAEAAAVGAG